MILVLIKLVNENKDMAKGLLNSLRVSPLKSTSV